MEKIVGFDPTDRGSIPLRDTILGVCNMFFGKKKKESSKKGFHWESREGNTLCLYYYKENGVSLYCGFVEYSFRLGSWQVYPMIGGREYYEGQSMEEQCQLLLDHASDGLDKIEEDKVFRNNIKKEIGQFIEKNNTAP